VHISTATGLLSTNRSSALRSRCATPSHFRRNWMCLSDTARLSACRKAATLSAMIYGKEFHQAHPEDMPQQMHSLRRPDGLHLPKGSPNKDRLNGPRGIQTEQAIHQVAKDHLRNWKTVLAHWFFRRQRKAYQPWAQQERVCHSCAAEKVIEITPQMSESDKQKEEPQVPNCKKRRGKQNGIPSKKQNLTESSKRKRKGNDTDAYATSSKGKKRRGRSSRWLSQRATHMFMLQANGWVPCANDFDAYGREYSGMTQQAWSFYGANEQQQPGS